MNRISAVASNTFREAVRDRVLYNLIFFALLLVGAALLFGQISIGIQRIVLVNLGLSAISVFGVVIAIFIGTGLVSKEMEKKTLYTILSRPVRRWEFIVGKFGGLAWTLVVNTFLMAVGFFAALLFLAHRFERGQSAFHAVDCIDDIGARLAEQNHQHRRLAVGEAEIAHVFDGIENLRHVRQPHRRAVAIGDHQRRVIGGLDRLIVGIDLKPALALIDGALGTIGIGGGERRAHVFQTDAVFEHGVRVDLDAHGGQCRAADDDLADAADLR